MDDSTIKLVIAAVIPIITSLISAFLGFFIAKYIADKKQSSDTKADMIKRTIELYTKFQSPTEIDIRHKALDAFMNITDPTYSQTGIYSPTASDAYDLHKIYKKMKDKNSLHYQINARDKFESLILYQSLIKRLIDNFAIDLMVTKLLFSRDLLSIHKTIISRLTSSEPDAAEMIREAQSVAPMLFDSGRQMTNSLV